MRKWASHIFCVIVATLVVFAFSPRSEEREQDDGLNLSRLQINDLRRVGEALIAVGERGSILKSVDDARTWALRHDDAALDITLTAVTALSPEVLLAVGHDGVMLRSTDAGDHWQKVAHTGVAGEPLLGAWSADGRRVYAYGSFGRFLLSTDGGLSWREEPLEVLRGEHLNGMDGDAGGQRMLVGEMGLVLRSLDDGHTWQRLAPFYNGSLFGVAKLSGPHWLTYGMRGHVFVSHDDGENWEQIGLPHQLPLYGHVRDADSAGVVIVGTGGAVVALDGQGRLLQSDFFQGVGTLTSVARLQGGRLFVAGQSGFAQGDNMSALVGEE